MQIVGLIPLKYSIYQAITSLYFLRIPINFCSLSYVKSAAIITGLDLSAPKKAYFKCLVIPSKLTPHNFFSTSYAFSSLLLDFSTLSSF